MGTLEPQLFQLKFEIQYFSFKLFFHCINHSFHFRFNIYLFGICIGKHFFLVTCIKKFVTQKVDIVFFSIFG
jgi:hypothetical protein